jgi:hypothetical protein
VVNEISRPEKCIGCQSMDKWINYPEDTSPVPRGEKLNYELIEDARRICPGVQIVISRNLDPSDIIKAENSYVLPVSGLQFMCNYYERAFGR